ncbi:DUF1971 domain-containing protein [Sphingomonas sp. RB3P16]|uniref:DUF1971 domain-containing protein n=1 Tax=Parasphingomonas frigoris TaxID=3096163 RepID=UPI002FCA51EE
MNEIANEHGLDADAVGHPSRHIPGTDSRAPSEPYRSSPVFTADTLPKALQHEHRTKRDVWGVINVLEGTLRYCKEDGSAPETLTPQSPGLVRPDEPHHVEVIGPVTVRIDFYDHEPRPGP